MNATLLIVGITAGCMTFLGGHTALYFKDRLHLILGFSGGAVIGVAFFDLIPEAVEIGSKHYDVFWVTTFIATGFLCYMFLKRAILAVEDMPIFHRGHIGPLTLTIHSFFDGIAIGIAFQDSTSVGIVVAVAVLVHDFSDGMNTVNLSLVGHNSNMLARRWLIADAIAPVLGIATTLLFTLPEEFLGPTLALFSGFFLYIGANELIPESYHRHPRFWTSFTTALGAIIIGIAIKFAE
ncbi:MAG: ZIP family metal transporter [Minisyncoccia bacterium]